MVTVLITLGLVGAVAAFVAASPGRASGGVDESRRRRHRYLDHHPESVNSGDVVALLSADLGAPRAREVMQQARRLHLMPGTMWAFAQAFGSQHLAVAVDAAVDEARLSAAVADGLELEWHDLEVLASLNRSTDLRAGRPPLPTRTPAASWLDVEPVHVLDLPH